jgi:ABC-type multidrug transport system fused ATPase/permease subunit
LSGVQIQLATCAVSFERIFHYVDLPAAAAPVPASSSSSSSSRRRRGSGTSSSRLRKEEQEEQEVPLLRLGDVVGDVRFEQVSFSYASPPPLLLDSSLPEGGAPPPEAAEEAAAGGGEGTRAPLDCGGKAEERPKGTFTRPEEEEAAAAEEEEETAVEEARRWTLADVSVHFRAGELTAIVGANGSGKTTLAFLLMGFLRPQRGEIFIDGHPLSRIAGSHHRSSSFCFPSRAPAPEPLGLAAHVGFLSQECYLLNDTVATNLRLGRADATTDELHEICRVVGVHDKICSLPDGYPHRPPPPRVHALGVPNESIVGRTGPRYDTVVGHRASSLSGGEKQKLAIARLRLQHCLHQPPPANNMLFNLCM